MDSLRLLRSRIALLIFATGIAFTTLPLPAQAQNFTVDAPAVFSPTTYVNSPFYMQVEAPTCNGAPTTSLGYTVSGQDGTTYVSGTTIQTMLTLAAGPYTIYLKSYNGTGYECTENVPVTVGGGVAVNAPTLSASLPETFNLVASAPTCGGQTTTGMGYNVDSQTEGSPINTTSLNTLVDSNVTSGAHVLRVKAWAGSIYCETDIPFTVIGGIAAPAGAYLYTGSNTGSSYPYSGIESDANYSGTYNSCPAGSVGGGNDGGNQGSLVDLWETEPDCGTVGNKSNVSTTYPSTTEVYGQNAASRQFAFTYSETGGGVRWFNQLLDNDNANAATYYLYDVYIYIASGSNVGEIELDINQASPANNYYLAAVQCNISTGVWDVTNTSESPEWVPTNSGCVDVTPNTWHHLQVESHRDGSTIYYDQASLDGNVVSLDCTECENSEKSTGWAESIGPNFQLDGGGSDGSSITAYASNMTIWYWTE
ncbi:MAG TPA: hypothetical protein VMD92_00230 [Acidobacteriaceae bacterium]|nr:hypothetical protein [Acidobacteriaceae bacterium]